MAETAMASAVTYGMMATEKAGEAETAAMAELMIDGTMKSVGETSIDAMAGPSSVTTGSGKNAQTVNTGLLESMNPMATGAMITGRDFTQAVSDDLNTEVVDTAKAIPYKQAAAARTFAIGKTLDSSDDMARLMLVTDYADLNMVKVFSEGDTSVAAVAGTKAGYLTIEDDETTGPDVNNVALRSEGMFTPVSGGTAGELAPENEVVATAKPVEVFSYTDPTDDAVKYATLRSTEVAGAKTTYSYTTGADIMHGVVQDGPDAETDPEQAQVTSGIPGPVAYQHLHFGVWASLGEAAKDGAQKVTGHGHRLRPRASATA